MRWSSNILRTTVFLATILGIILESGCDLASGNSRAEQEAMSLVTNAISGYTKNQGITSATFYAGELDGGCAVLLGELNDSSLDAAFWVRAVVVHTINDTSRTIAPQLTPAPESITLERVMSVVR